MFYFSSSILNGLDKMLHHYLDYRNRIPNLYGKFINNIDLAIIVLLNAIPIFYLSLYLLIPKLLFRRSIVGVIFFIVSLIAYYFVSKLITGFIFPLIYILGIPYSVKVLLPLVLLSSIGGAIFAFSEKAKREKRDKGILEKKNIQLELDLLKSTINPHFLFNTLNNIDILIDKDSQKASNYLKKLSNILRFMLNSSKNDFIPLETEIDFIKQYIELQKIRTSNPGFIKINVKGIIKNWKIAPMLFVPFVENAFKYSSNKKIKNAINIIVNTTSESITFTCINAISGKESDVKKNGLGINLIKQRLNLIYQGKYQLNIEPNSNEYKVSLIINK